MTPSPSRVSLPSSSLLTGRTPLLPGCPPLPTPHPCSGDHHSCTPGALSARLRPLAVWPWAPGLPSLSCGFRTCHVGAAVGPGRGNPARENRHHARCMQETQRGAWPLVHTRGCSLTVAWTDGLGTQSMVVQRSTWKRRHLHNVSSPAVRPGGSREPRPRRPGSPARSPCGRHGTPLGGAHCLAATGPAPSPGTAPVPSLSLRAGHSSL